MTRLAGQPAPWIVENVATAQMRADFMLCGSMFGLNVYRHRKFHLDPRVGALLALPPHPRHRVASDRRKSRASVAAGYVLGVHGNLHPSYFPHAAAAMGIDWMSQDEEGYELSQAIPPAYTEYIGAQLLEML